jgi:hypothetical protein
VNFFHPWITIPLVEPNIMDHVHMQQPPSSSSKLLPLVFQGGLELKESICVDIAHPILQFNVLHWKKPQRSNANKDQPLHIYKWNSCSILIQVFGYKIIMIIRAP